MRNADDYDDDKDENLCLNTVWLNSRGDGPLTAQMTEVYVEGELLGESW